MRCCTQLLAVLLLGRIGKPGLTVLTAHILPSPLPLPPAGMIAVPEVPAALPAPQQQQQQQQQQPALPVVGAPAQHL